jgi:hypothetical protein
MEERPAFIDWQVARSVAAGIILAGVVGFVLWLAMFFLFVAAVRTG